MSDSTSTPVIVSSCDAYHDAWRAFFTLLFRYWPSCPFPLYLVSNYLSSPDNRVVTIQCGDDQGWAANMRKALAKIESDYIIYMHEDYFLNRPVDNQRILKLLRFAIDEDAACLRLYPSPGPDKPYSDDPEEIGEISPEAPYRVSLQAAIWNKDIFSSLLVDGETGWDMELKGTLRSRDISRPFLSVKSRPKRNGLHNPAISYIHRTAIYKGRWTRQAVQLCRRERLQVDFSKHPVEPSLTPRVLLYRWYWKTRVLLKRPFSENAK